MSLGPGTRLGPYEILSAVGAGGMGEVYRARDTRLNRDIAIKVLPTAFSSDPERLARFRREAQFLASLNHPHIAAIYGFEESGEVHALVLELVEGETLADRIARGAVSLEDALPIAKQIAEALEAAHEQGIIHRDLKPANVKVRADGTVKVLDFGLAKLSEPASSRQPAASGALSLSPTVTSPAIMTGVGVFLGTAAYMSPEQAAGKPVDKRADLWAFGVVLMEMLTGRRVFDGETVSHVLAAVLKDEPDWKTLPSNTPTSIRRLLRRCLEKDPRRRLDSAAAARLEIDEAVAAPSGDATSTDVRVDVHSSRWRGGLPWALLAGALIALVVVLALWAPWRSVPPPESQRLSVELGADASLEVDEGAAAVLSPDGRSLVFAAQSTGGGAQLFVRRLDQLAATPLAGTEGARNPFFSPDSQWVAFFAEAKLKKIPVTGGTVVTLADSSSRGGAWAEDGTIVFTSSRVGGGRPVLLRVSSAGGIPQPLTTLAEGEVSERWPQLLPGGKALVYTSGRSLFAWEDASLVVQPLPAGERKIVQRGGYYGRYLPSGHLVYVHEGTLFAVPFDLDRLKVNGQAVPVLEGVIANQGSGGAQIAVSNNGTLVYQTRQSATRDAPIAWMNSSGKTTPLRAAASNWSDPQFAPDGRRLAVDIIDKQTDIWVYEWARDSLTRLTFDPAPDRSPVWTPDGRRIVFGSSRNGGTFNLYWQRANGTGDVQRLTESKSNQLPGTWHPSGKLFAFTEASPQTGFDVMILSIDGDEASGWKPGKPSAFLDSPFDEADPMFSPDGRWMAYDSNESGRREVYVRPFPGPGGKWQVSTAGGSYPTWSRVRHELLYAAPDNRIMVANYTVDGDSFQAAKPTVWSETRFASRSLRSFDLHPDGERFAIAPMPAAQAAAKQDKVVFIFNFFDELRRLAPAH